MSGRRRAWAVSGLLVQCGLLVGCAIERGLPAPSCETGDTVIHAAQSVATAELVPCFEPLPAGWHVDTVRVDQDGTVVTFDSDRAGDEAATFLFTETCEIGDAVSAPSEHDGTMRHELIERVSPAFRAQRFYEFPGGCVRWEFDFDADATAALSVELGDRLSFRTRDALNESIRESFVDEEV